MRWIVFFLLVLNAVFFSWFYLQQGQHAEVHVEKTQAFNFSKVPTLTLLQDVPEAELLGVAEEPEPLEQPAGADVCMVVGPYAEVVSAKQARSRLEKAGVSSDIAVIEKQLPTVHWVYIKPSKDRKTALAILQQLQKQKIDSFLISEGEFEHAISLGFFSKEESARQVLKERKSQGFNASMMEKVRVKEQFWLAVQGTSVEKITDNLLLELKKDFSDIKKQEKSCEDVALFKIIE